MSHVFQTSKDKILHVGTTTNDGKIEVSDNINPSYKDASKLKVAILKELNPAHINVGQPIAEGFFGIVYAGTLLSTSVAVKTFKDTVQNVTVDKELKLIQ